MSVVHLEITLDTNTPNPSPTPSMQACDFVPADATFCSLLGRHKLTRGAQSQTDGNKHGGTLVGMSKQHAGFPQISIFRHKAVALRGSDFQEMLEQQQQQKKQQQQQSLDSHIDGECTADF